VMQAASIGGLTFRRWLSSSPAARRTWPRIEFWKARLHGPHSRIGARPVTCAATIELHPDHNGLAVHNHQCGDCGPVKS
jgi:hypothetical protein